MNSPIARIVFDCTNPERVTDFWASVTGYEKRMFANGEGYLKPAQEGIPAMMFMPVNSPKIVKNRVHVEINTQDLEADVAQLTELGANLVAQHREEGVTWAVMADPEGNEFCVVKFD